MDLRNYFSETNANMRRVLRHLTARRRSAEPVIGPLNVFSMVVLSPLVEIDGSVFLEMCVPAGFVDEKFIPNEWLVNRSCWEQAYNRVELGQGIAARHSGPELVEHGIAIAELICLKLRANFPRRRFRLHVSWNAKPLFESQRRYEQTRKCVVSFWQERRGEHVFAPLTEFKHDAIGELTVSLRRHDIVT